MYIHRYDQNEYKTTMAFQIMYCTGVSLTWMCPDSNSYGYLASTITCFSTTSSYSPLIKAPN